MQNIAVLGVMIGCAMVSLFGVAILTRRGHAGLALSIGAVLGGAFTVLLYAAGRPFGIDPILAMSLAMLLILPALLGACAGGGLGWMLRRRDDRR